MASQPTKLGHFEENVLLAALRLGDRAYGSSIRQEVENAEREVNSRRTVSIGAVYATLDRLERKGFITSRMGEATGERGGRRKRYFMVLGTGEAALEEARSIRRVLRGDIGDALPQPA